MHAVGDDGREYWEELLSGEALLRLRRGEHWDAIERLVDPEFTMENFDEAPFQGPYVGYDGLRKWAEDTMDALEDGGWWEFVESEWVGDWLVATSRVQGTWRVSGIPHDLLFFTAARSRDGRAYYSKGFLRKEDALAFARERSAA